jgi:ketosteroid isomerase-like protein
MSTHITEDLNMSVQPTLQDRRDLEDALLAYLTAVDGMDDLDAMAAVFTDDAVLDLSGLELGVYEGAAAIRGFYAGVFETMSHHMHTMTNFRVLEFGGDTARTYAYICGMGRSHQGVDIQVYVYYDLQMRRTASGWKIAHFYEAAKLPMPPSVGLVHKDK